MTSQHSGKITMRWLKDSESGQKNAFVVELHSGSLRKILYAGTLTQGDSLSIGPLDVRMLHSPTRLN